MDSIVIPSVDELGAAAQEFIRKIGDRKLVAFFAPMGAGKTTFITAICKALGVRDTVCSPTFTIINEYKSGSGDSIFHFDFYRIEKISQAYDIGVEDYLYSGSLCLMEWSENVEEILPSETLKVSIEVLPDEKRVVKFLNL